MNEMEWRARNGCGKKRAYLTRALARSGMQAVRKRVPQHLKKTIGVYRCEFCKLWHVGKKKKKVLKALKKRKQP